MNTAKRTFKMVNKCSSIIKHIIERYRNENRIENTSRLASNKIFDEREDFKNIILKEVHQKFATR